MIWTRLLDIIIITDYDQLIILSDIISLTEVVTLDISKASMSFLSNITAAVNSPSSSFHKIDTELPQSSSLVLMLVLININELLSAWFNHIHRCFNDCILLYIRLSQLSNVSISSLPVKVGTSINTLFFSIAYNSIILSPRD